MLCDLAPDYIKSIAPYLPGKPISELAREIGMDASAIVKLASNENPLGMSPKAESAIQEALAEVARYPDGNCFLLREAIVKKFGVKPNSIIFGNGSNDILELAARAFLCNGVESIYSQHAFAVYPLVTQAVGARGNKVPAKNFGHDLEEMAKAVNSSTRVIFIANPNNPTGTLLDGDQIYSFLKIIPRNVLVVLDEAYDEYLSNQKKSEAINWIGEFENLLISRTFSKAFGLAGLRIGFGLASPQIIDIMNRVRQPFNVNSLAQAASAASLFDDSFVERSRALNQAGLHQIEEGLRKLNLDFIPSSGNFISFRVGNATEIYNELLLKGVIVRPVANYEMPDYLRVSIGLFKENEKFLDSLESIVKTK